MPSRSPSINVPAHVVPLHESISVQASPSSHAPESVMDVLSVSALFTEEVSVVSDVETEIE
jgi:hypothetical protein